MALGIARILTVLSILQLVLQGNEKPDLITRINLRRYEACQEQQQQWMTHLQQQMEQKRQEPRGLHEAVLLAVRQHCGFGLAAEALLTLLGLLWLRRKKRADAARGSQRESSVSAEQNPGQREGRALQHRAQANAASSPFFGSAFQKREATAGTFPVFSEGFPRATS